MWRQPRALPLTLGPPISVEHNKWEQAGTRTSVVAAVVLFGVSKGMDAAEFERVTGLSFSKMLDPQGRVPDASLAAAWRLIGAAFPDEAPALQLASAAPMSIFGPLAQAARHAATRLEALNAFVRYQKSLSGGLEMTLVPRETQVFMRLEHTLDAIDDGHGAEAAVALGARMGREVMGTEHAVVSVSFSHQPHGPVSAYEAWFGHPVLFGRAETGVLFERAPLDLPPLRPDPVMYAHIQAHLDQVRQALLDAAVDAPLDRVKLGISELAKRSEYSAEVLAKSLGMSLRTLQRYTTKHGASLRELIDGVRAANARELLSDETLSVEQVAFLVGYSDDRAFRRAFQRWTGRSPTAFRVEVS